MEAYLTPTRQFIRMVSDIGLNIRNINNEYISWISAIAFI
jgi:hypothetical protein